MYGQRSCSYWTMSLTFLVVLFSFKPLKCSSISSHSLTTEYDDNNLPGFGSLDVYNNFQWKVEKVTGKEDIAENTEVVELALAMDCTGSMSSWIEHSKNTLSQVIDTIKEKMSKAGKQLVFRVAFVGFRDFGDGNDIFSVHDFTKDTKALKDFISTQRARGGGDLPEDVTGAMHQVLQLSWSEESTRLVAIIADAPTHGKQYHNVDDKYPQGSPAGLVLENLVKKFTEQRMDLTLYKLTDYTEKMYTIMKAADKGGDWVRFVDIRDEIEENRNMGYDESSDYIADTYANYSASVFSDAISAHSGK